MSTVGLRELRQQAAELVRRAEAGEEVTVAGRPTARLVPVAPQDTWYRFDGIADLWSDKADPDWAADRDLIDQGLRDPWTS